MKKNTSIVLKVSIFLILSIIFIIFGKKFYLYTLDPYDFIQTVDKEHKPEKLIHEEKVSDDIAVVFYKDKENRYLCSIIKINKANKKILGTNTNDSSAYTFNYYEYKENTYSITWTISNNFDIKEIYFNENLGHITNISDENIRILWSVDSLKEAPKVNIII